MMITRLTGTTDTRAKQLHGLALSEASHVHQSLVCEGLTADTLE